MSGNGWAAALAIALIAFLQAATAWLTLQTKRTGEAGNTATEAQNETLDFIAELGDSTHDMMNSQYGLLLKQNLDLRVEKAQLSGRVEDHDAAKLAEKELKEHRDMERLTALKKLRIAKKQRQP